MKITRCKSGMGSFLHKLEPWRTLLGFSLVFTQAWTMEKSVWIYFHVYTSLKWKTTLEISLHAPNIMTQSRYMPPKLHFSQLGGWNEGSLSRSGKDLTGILRDLNQRLYLEKRVVSFFNKVDTVKEPSLWVLFHFLTSLRQEKNYAHRNLFMASIWKKHIPRDTPRSWVPIDIHQKEE